MIVISQSFRLLLMLAVLASWFCGVECSNSQTKFPGGWENDSALRDVHFVDLDLGWAVGDRGTILRTEDGGRTWTSFTAPRDMQWNDVFFLNDQVGWIAGGHHRGGVQRSVGVMIQTKDGGKTWKNVSRDGISQINRIKFFDEANGWMLCDTNHLHTSGMMITKDGGGTWLTSPKVSEFPVQLADAANPHVVLGVDAKGQLVNSVQNSKSKASFKHINSVSVDPTGFAIRLDSEGRLTFHLIS